MNLNDLKKLHAAVESLLRQESFPRAVEHMKLELGRSAEPFVWCRPGDPGCGIASVNQIRLDFSLEGRCASGCHYHPNSVQHMVALNGHGRAKVGDVERPMIPFGRAGNTIEEKWYVIREGVPHEFFPEDEDLTVVSFHTCEAFELEEIACGNGTSRKYESTDTQVER